jgi:hypothetical protein
VALLLVPIYSARQVTAKIHHGCPNIEESTSSSHPLEAGELNAVKKASKCSADFYLC